MSKPQKSKAQRERDSAERAERKLARAASTEPKDAKGRTASDRRREAAERKEQLKQEAIDRAREARHAVAIASAEDGEPFEDFGMEGIHDETGRSIFRAPGPRMPAEPAYDLVPFKGEPIEGTVEKHYALDPGQRAVFLKKYAESGNIGAAAWHAGTTIERTNRLRKADPLFDAQLTESLARFKSSLVVEAVRRGRDGWQEPVYQQGVLAGYKRMFDGPMLQMLMRSHIPETYGDKATVEHKVQGVLVLHDERPISAEEWLNERAEAHEAALAQRNTNLLEAAAGKKSP